MAEVSMSEWCPLINMARKSLILKCPNYPQMWISLRVHRSLGHRCFWIVSTQNPIKTSTLQGTNISHLGKKGKSSSNIKHTLGGDPRSVLKLCDFLYNWCKHRISCFWSVSVENIFDRSFAISADGQTTCALNFAKFYHGNLRVPTPQCHEIAGFIKGLWSPSPSPNHILIRRYFLGRNVALGW